MDDSDYDYYENESLSDEDNGSGDEEGDVEYMTESDDDYGFVAGAEEVTATRKFPYSILTRPELIKKREESLQSVTCILGIEEEDAARVLRKYKWDVGRVNEEWFSDIEAVRDAVGLMDPQPGPSGRTQEQCLICFETFTRSDMREGACHHAFCKDCWKSYVCTAIEGGPTCLDLRCPLPACKACVPESIVREVGSAAHLAKYDRFKIRTFVEDNRNMSWCTGAGCDNAIECVVDRAPDEPLDVICSCGATFCFNCKEEAHRPVLCETVRQWITKNSAESENMNWILANTKPCPKCHRPIEKNQGCMHMTCSQCKYEFCWLCQSAWSEHGERTGGYYACNRYEAAKKKGEYDDDTRRRQNAKQSLERYMHYFERFDTHHKSREQAVSDLYTNLETYIEKLSDLTKLPTSQLKFIGEAYQQVIECRRMLKWTYAYGYYAFLNDEVAEVQRQREFFEFLQGDAEGSLEKLHDIAESELKDLLKSGTITLDTFQSFRKRLIGLTDVTHSFFDKLVKQLEKGFDDMGQMYAGEEGPAGQGAGAGTSSAPPSAPSNKDDSRKGKRSRWVPRKATFLEAMRSSVWNCNDCTYRNATGDVCEMCGRPR